MPFRHFWDRLCAACAVVQQTPAAQHHHPAGGSTRQGPPPWRWRGHFILITAISSSTRWKRNPGSIRTGLQFEPGFWCRRATSRKIGSRRSPQASASSLDCPRTLGKSSSWLQAMVYASRRSHPCLGSARARCAARSSPQSPLSIPEKPRAASDCVGIALPPSPTSCTASRRTMASAVRPTSPRIPPRSRGQDAVRRHRSRAKDDMRRPSDPRHPDRGYPALPSSKTRLSSPQDRLRSRILHSERST